MIMILNVTLAFVFCTIGLSDLASARLFTFEWTARMTPLNGSMGIEAARDQIYKMYNESTDYSVEHLSAMMETTLKLGHCKPVMLEGGLSWAPNEVSPTCNCLWNYHIEYIKEARPGGRPLPPPDQQREDVKERLYSASLAFRDKCFNSLRYTQVCVCASSFCECE